MRFIKILLFLMPCAILSQTITGVVKDKTAPVPWANIILKDSANQIVTGTTSDDNGAFTITTKTGQYKLVVSFLGYVDVVKTINVLSDIDLGVIILEEDANQLDEVVIKAKKRVFERQPDRLVFNVENAIATKGTDALQALKITPGLMVNTNAIELLGRGASRVMVNGRLVQLSGEELINYLNTMSSDDIQKIEVITNPPAKYEASGNGGLINIILKKGRLNSWKNSTTLSYTQQFYQYGTLRNNFSYNKSKLQIGASLNATKGDLRNFEELYIEYPKTPWQIDIDTKQNKDAYSGRLALDYDISDTFSLGILYMGSQQTPGGFTTTTSHILDANNQLSKYLLNEGDNNIKSINHALNLHSVIVLDTLGRSVSFDVDAFRYDNTNNRAFTTKDFDANHTFLKLSSSAISKAKQTITNYSTKIDVTHPFKAIQLAYGGKYNTTKSSSDVAYFDKLSGKTVLDALRSNNFEYQESNVALYALATKVFNEKWTVKTGLRAEHTTTNGFSKSLNQTNKNEYTKLFPTVYTSYKNNANNQFTASYGKRIERPGFNLLNPFRYYISENSYSEGNPLLQPSFSNNFEVSHSYKNKLTTSISLSVIEDGFGVVFTTDEVDQIQVVTRENYFKQRNYTISESYVFNTNWLQSQNSVSVIGYNSVFREGFNAVPKNGVQLMMSTNNTISVNENSKFQINSWYSSAHDRGLFSVNEMFNLSIGYQQSFFDNAFSFSLMFNDVFNSSRLTDFSSDVNGITQHYGQDNGKRNVLVSLSYNFGNDKIKTKNRQFGNDDERNRTE